MAMARSSRLLFYHTTVFKLPKKVLPPAMKDIKFHTH